MTKISALTLTEVVYNGSAGRVTVKKGVTISDLSDDECAELERLKGVKRLPVEEVTPSQAPSESVPSRIRRKKRGR